MYIGTYARILMLSLLLTGCAAQGGARSGALEKPPESLVELMDYTTRVTELGAADYQRELNAARSEFDRSGSTKARLRLVILLMNDKTGHAGSHFRESENLLKNYIGERSFMFFDRDYGAFARMLLTINQEWQRMQNQLAAARVETADAEKKLEELKSIELQLNHPDNGYH